MRSSLALLAFALASCETPSTLPSPPADSSPPASPSPPASFLARFADAMRFVPAGMQSHWFSDHRNLDSSFDTRPKRLRVRCARNFQAPRDVGVGAYEGVTIQDHGASPIPAQRRALGELRPSIAAEVRWQPGLQSTGRVYNWETWSAIVDERFVVTATSEELLRQALARNGKPSFGKLEPLPDFDPATVDVVLRDLAGSKPVDAPIALNVKGVSAVAALVSLPVRVQIWARDPRELQAMQGLFDPVNGWNAPKRHAQQADLHFLEIEKSPDAEEPLATSRLHLERCFGLWISI